MKLEFPKPTTTNQKLSDLKIGEVALDTDGQIFIRDDQGGVVRLSDGYRFDQQFVLNTPILQNYGNLEVTVGGKPEGHYMVVDAPDEEDDSF